MSLVVEDHSESLQTTDMKMSGYMTECLFKDLSALVHISPDMLKKKKKKSTTLTLIRAKDVA